MIFISCFMIFLLFSRFKFEVTCNYCLVSRHWLMITSFLFHVSRSFHVEIQNYFMFDDQITCYHILLCNMKSVWNMKLISCLHELISCFIILCNMKLFLCLLEIYHTNLKFLWHFWGSVDLHQIMKHEVNSCTHEMNFMFHTDFMLHRRMW